MSTNDLANYLAKGISSTAMDGFRIVYDSPKNETLEQHREHCEAEEGNCPFEKKADKTDDLTKKENVGKTSEQLDAEYMEIANRIASAKREGRDADAKDIETAARMVREAAALAMPNTKVVDNDGMPLVVWRGSMQDGNVIETEKRNSFLSNNEDVAFAFGGGEKSNIRQYFVDIKNPLVVRANGENWDNILITYDDCNKIEQKFDDYVSEHEQGGPISSVFSHIINLCVESGIDVDDKGYYLATDDIAEIAKKSHYYDGAIINNVNEMFRGEIKGVTDYVCVKPSQIKSADPVTYDDDGNVIPLSKRFNFESADVRDEATGKIKKYLDMTEGA